MLKLTLIFPEAARDGLLKAIVNQEPITVNLNEDAVVDKMEKLPKERVNSKSLNNMRWTVSENEELMKMYWAGKTMKYIGKKLKRSPTAVNQQSLQLRRESDLTPRKVDANGKA